MTHPDRDSGSYSPSSTFKREPRGRYGSRWIVYLAAAAAGASLVPAVTARSGPDYAYIHWPVAVRCAGDLQLEERNQLLPQNPDPHSRYNVIVTLGCVDRTTRQVGNVITAHLVTPTTPRVPGEQLANIEAQYHIGSHIGPIPVGRTIVPRVGEIAITPVARNGQTQVTQAQVEVDDASGQVTTLYS